MRIFSLSALLFLSLNALAQETKPPVTPPPIPPPPPAATDKPAPLPPEAHATQSIQLGGKATTGLGVVKMTIVEEGA